MNLTSVRKEPVKLRIKSKRRKNNNKQVGNNEDTDNKGELIKQEDKKEDYEVKFVNEDEIKKPMILDKLQDKSRGNAFGHFGMKKEEVKKINDFGTYDGIVDHESDNDNNGFGTSSEVSLSPHHRTVQLTEYGSKHMMSSMSWISKNYDH